MKRSILFADEVRGNPGAFIVTLDCGHKLGTREQLVQYECRECPKEPTTDKDREIARLQGEMRAIMRRLHELGATGTLVEFVDLPGSNWQR
jgi:hypothetical protein